MDRANEALRIAERIAVLRSEIATLEAEFRRIIDAPVAAMRARATREEPEPREEDSSGNGAAGMTAGSIAERSAAILRAEPKRTFTISEIRALLPDVDDKSLRGTLGRLARDKNGMRRIGRGRYKFHQPPEAAQAAQ